MTTSQKLWLGFGTLTGLLVLSGVAILARVRSIEGLVHEQTSVARPRSAAVRELEIHMLGYTLNVRACLMNDDPELLLAAGIDAAAVENELAAYERLATTDEQREMTARFRASWRELRDFGQAALDSKDQPLEQADSERLAGLRIGLEKLLDGEMQPDASAHYDASRDAALQDVQAIVGFVALLLLLGVIIAVVMATTVGRGIVNAQRALAEQAERWRTTLASIGDAVIATDKAGRITNMNPVAESLTGWTNAEARDQPLDAVFRIVNEDTRQPVESSVTRALREGVVVGLANHTVLVRKDGTEQPIDDSAAPIRCKDGEVVGCVLVFRDVTERREAEQELAEVAIALSEADRRKNEFLAILAHELRNPLAPIRNAVQVLRLRGGNAEAVASASEILERQVGQIVRLVEDLLDVSRISRGKLELRRRPVELASVVNQAVEAARSLVQCMEHDLSVRLPPQPLYLNADPARLAQVMGNLLDNACKFTHRGGRLSITVEREDQQAAIRVRDTGIGITSDQLTRIFDMFAQVDTSLERSTSGLGIGLTLVRNLVELHGGTVEVHSAGAGQGCEFVVRLPLAVETSEPAPEPTVSDPPPGKLRRVLIVDDNWDSATSLEMLVKLTGPHETHVAYDGLEGVKAAATFRPHVVLLDIGLPKLNGYDACRRIRKQPWSDGMLLVAVTGWGQEEDREKSQDAGFNAHMVKPVGLAALMKLLDSVSPESE